MHHLVVHCKREEFDVYIGRPGPWGNIFIIGPDGDRNQVCDKHDIWLREQIKLGSIEKSDLLALKGKRLGCWCGRALRCHGDNIVRLIEELS